MRNFAKTIAASAVIATVGLVAALMSPFTFASAATGTRTTVWAFGDSVGAGGWLDDTSLGWVDRVKRYAAPLGVDIVNYSRGGAIFHNTKGDNSNTFMTNIKAAFAANPGVTPDVVIVAGGTNDVGSHALNQPSSSAANIDYTLYAMADIQNYLNTKGVKKVIWNTVYPYAPHETPTWYGASIPGAWVPELQGRVNYINSWLYAMWPTQVINSNATLIDWPKTTQGKPSLFLDGFHPTAEGHLRIAQAYTIDALTTMQPAR